MLARSRLLLATQLCVVVACGCGNRGLPVNSDGGVTEDAGLLEHPMPADMGSDSRNVVTSPVTVRQGADGTLVLSGAGVERVVQVTAPSRPQISITPMPDSTGQPLTLKVSVPHATPLGPVDLVINFGDSAETRTGLIVVSPIEVGPHGKDDGAGTSDEPFATMMAALQVSGPGDTIRLENSQDPYAISGSLTLPPGLSLIGESTVGVSVDAATSGGSLVFGGDTTIRQLTLANFAKGCGLCIQVRSALTFDRVVARNNAPLAIPSKAPGSSLVVEGAESDLSYPGDALTVDADDVSVIIRQGARLTAAGRVMRVSGARAKVSIESGTLASSATATSYSAIYASGPPEISLSFVGATLNGGVYLASQGGTISAMGSSFSTAVSYALNFGGTQMSLDGTTLEGPGNILQGITSWPSSAKVRSTTFRYTGGVGYKADQGVVDLGTADSSGDNVFLGMTEGYALDIAGAGVSEVDLSISHSTVNGGSFPPMVTSGPLDLAPTLRAGRNAMIRSF